MIALLHESGSEVMANATGRPIAPLILGSDERAYLERQVRRHRVARSLSKRSERKGVCCDFAHLAVAFCRCMNIPARYANGFLADIGVPPDPSPMDYNAWFEVYLDGRWFTFDARHNVPRIGRITVARGRDAADIALVEQIPGLDRRDRQRGLG
jgi:transglutaminase-like putative cysteine protease